MVPEPAAMSTKQRIVEAALETLKEEGFAGTSARAIARRGDFNQALIFYHFGTLNDLLLAALDATSLRSLVRYRTRLPGAHTIDEKLRVATELYREDLESGHVTAISEMIAGSLSRPDLGPEVVARMDPWIDFAEETIREVLAGTGLEEVVKPRSAAFAIIALSLGVNLLSHIDRDNARAEAVFELAGDVARLFGPLLDAR